MSTRTLSFYTQGNVGSFKTWVWRWLCSCRWRNGGTWPAWRCTTINNKRVVWKPIVARVDQLNVISNQFQFKKLAGQLEFSGITKPIARLTCRKAWRHRGNGFGVSKQILKGKGHYPAECKGIYFIRRITRGLCFQNSDEPLKVKWGLEGRPYQLYAPIWQGNEGHQAVWRRGYRGGWAGRNRNWDK